jgi:hypothetical protein
MGLEPVMTEILVTLGMQWGADCRTYLGVTSICFMPEATDTRACPVLAADTRDRFYETPFWPKNKWTIFLPVLNVKLYFS